MFPSNIDAETTENRIIVLTDDQPNTGNTSEKSCTVKIRKNYGVLKKYRK